MARGLKTYATWFAVFALLVYSSPILFEGGRGVRFFEQVVRLLGEFFPPDLTVLPDVFAALGETIRIATLSTFFAVIFSIPCAIGASRVTGNRWSRSGVRLILSGIRTVPSLIWAVVAVALIGPSAKAGVFALTLYSVGYLGKFFTEILDQADQRPAQWLRTLRAHPIQVFQYSLWPHLRAALASQSLWMWEYNIRSASIIGYVGAGGLGLQLQIYQEFGQWSRFCTVLLVIFALVVALEFLSEWIKKQSTVARV